MHRSHPWAFAAGLAVLLAAGHGRAQERFALQMFHFNVQYVCGGTIGFTPQPNDELDLDNDTMEDRIITEGLAPIIRLFERHPTWGVDIEMQGYMLDIIAERHPDLLDTMRAMAQAGQIDILSFHYSDQLFIAYPEEDWLRSQDLTAATFAQHDVPLSRSVFCQEGQASEGMAARMHERGYRTLVWPKNLWIYQHDEFDAAPLYSFGDVLAVAGSKGVSTADVEVEWTFFDDGELLATGDIDPYFVEVFFEKPEAIAEYETRLSDLEADGYRIATVNQYVDAIQSLVTPVAMPPLLDGTWQPQSTQAVKRWLGGGGVWKPQERDNHVRTMGLIAHRELMAAETIAAQAGLDLRAKLDGAWRMMFLGQVSDGSGINPFRGEIEYSISHVAEAARIAREVIAEAKEALGHAEALIDPGAGTVTTHDGAAILRGSAADPPIALVVNPGDRSLTESWEQIAPGHHRVTLDFGPGEFNVISARFPGTGDELTVTVALQDEAPVTYQRSDFAFETFYLALPTGLISLGQNRFVIKDQGHVHLAAELSRDDGDIIFTDETAGFMESQRWVFHLFEGSAADAVAQARAINGQRRVVR
ncbi:MAG: hypothetical protein JRI23_01440 [Deltaproteobacteria bacterium]|nr:hypothetical protein [Deltaproteobacteria bacterium]MBW2530125.1 hypothetical protein [Deltaproteobacteria bacterium]